MTNGDKNRNVLTQQTRVSVALLIILVGGAFAMGSSIAWIKAEQTNIQAKVKQIDSEYVPRTEIEKQLQNINQKLDRLMNK